MIKEDKSDYYLGVVAKIIVVLLLTIFFSYSMYLTFQDMKIDLRAKEVEVLKQELILEKQLKKQEHEHTQKNNNSTGSMSN